MSEALTSVRGMPPRPQPMEDSVREVGDDARRDDRIRTRLIAEGFIVAFTDKQNWNAIPPSQQEWSF
jgi:hypothetical protein